MEGSFLKLPVLRNNYRNIFFQIMHEYMTASLVIHDEPYPAQGFYDLNALKCPAQMDTSISFRIELGADLIWFTSSRPSR